MFNFKIKGLLNGRIKILEIRNETQKGNSPRLLRIFQSILPILPRNFSFPSDVTTRSPSRHTIISRDGCTHRNRTSLH